MHKLFIPFSILLTLLLAGCSSLPSFTKLGKYDLYLPGRNSDVAVILCHGRGRNANSYVVGPLRTALNSQLGYHTYSLQMPVVEAGWQEYVFSFPDAFKKINNAITDLRTNKGIKSIYLVGHSMGARMATAYLKHYPDAGISGFIGVGMRNNGGGELSTRNNLKSVTIPVLDISGSLSPKDIYHGYQRQELISRNYKQVTVSGADHRFTHHEKQLVNTVVNWLRDHQ